VAFKSKNYYIAEKKLYVFHKRKFPKVKSETQVSFVNEAPGHFSLGLQWKIPFDSTVPAARN
jgi:hypothetical protein